VKKQKQEIELTWGDVRSKTFIGIIQRMLQSRLPFEVTVSLLSLAKKINEEKELSDVLFAKLEEEYTTLVKVEGQPDQRVIIKEKNKEFEAEFKQASEHSFTVQSPKFSTELLSKLELSVNELLAIKPLLLDADMIQGMDVETATSQTHVSN